MANKNHLNLCPKDSRHKLPRRSQNTVITPDIAQDWLNTRNDTAYNRRLSMPLVRNLVGAIQRGEWKLTHQGIAFDTDGWLIDGQHRLEACSRSGLEIEVPVAVDMPRDTFDVIDAGRGRQAHQLLHIPNAGFVAAAAKHLIRAEMAQTDPVVRAMRSATVDVSNHQIVQAVHAWPELGEAMRSASRCMSRAGVAKTQHAALIAQIMRSDHANLLDEWIEGIAEGEMLGKMDPRFRVRAAFYGSQRKVTMSVNSQGYAILVKAWNSYVLNENIRQLSWHGRELIQDVLDVNWK